MGFRARRATLYSTSPHSRPRAYQMVVTCKFNWPGKRWGLEPGAEPSIPPVNRVPHGGQMESWRGKRWGLEPGAEPSLGSGTERQGTTNAQAAGPVLPVFLVTCVVSVEYVPPLCFRLAEWRGEAGKGGGVKGSEGVAAAIGQRECGNPLLIPSGFDSVELSECGLPYICFLLVAPSF